MAPGAAPERPRSFEQGVLVDLAAPQPALQEDPDLAVEACAHEGAVDCLRSACKSVGCS